MFSRLITSVSHLSNIKLLYAGGLHLSDKLLLLSKASSYCAFPGSVGAPAAAMWLPFILLNVGTPPLLGDELPQIRWGAKEIPESLRYMQSVYYPLPFSNFCDSISLAVSTWITAKF